LKRVVKV